MTEYNLPTVFINALKDSNVNESEYRNFKINDAECESTTSGSFCFDKYGINIDPVFYKDKDNLGRCKNIILKLKSVCATVHVNSREVDDNFDWQTAENLLIEFGDSSFDS